MEEMGFVQWAMFLDYTTFVTFVFAIVEFTKSLKYIKKIPTRYWSAFIAFSLLIIVNLHNGTFVYWDIILYLFTSMIVSLTANGLATVNSKKEVK